MTLAALLEELKEVDAEQSEKLQCWIGRTRQFMNLEVPLECDLAQALIQGCIQQACERRGWDLRQDQWVVNLDSTDEVYYYSAIVTGISETGRSPEYEGRGKSQAEALLAAYIAAVKKEAKR